MALRPSDAQARGPSAATPRPAARKAPPAFSLDVLRVSLFLFIIVSISAVQGYLRPLAVLRPGITLWGLAIGAVLFAPRGVRWANLRTTWPPKAMGVLVLLATLSAPFGLSIGASANFMLSAYIRIVVLFVMLVIALRTTNDVRLFVFAFVLSAGILALLSMTVMQVEASYGGTRVTASSMYDANDLGMIFLSSIPLAVLLWEFSGLYGKILVAACLALTSGAIALTGSRGAFVGLALVLPLLGLAMSHISLARRAGFGVAVVLGLFVAAPEGYWDRIGTIFAVSDDYNVTDPYGRVAIAKRGVGYMVTHPMGVGIANFPRAEFTISPLAKAAGYGDQVRAIAPHNTYVQVGAEMGVLALVVWCSLLVSGTLGLWAIRPRARRLSRESGGRFEERFVFRATSLLPVTFVGFAITSYFVSHAYTPIFYILVAILTGILAMHRQQVIAARMKPGSGK